MNSMKRILIISLFACSACLAADRPSLRQLPDSPSKLIETLRASRDGHTVWELRLDYVKESDLPFLVRLLDSEEPCAHVVSAESSILPTGPSTVGHEAAYLIEGFWRRCYPTRLSSHMYKPDIAGIKSWYAVRCNLKRLAETQQAQTKIRLPGLEVALGMSVDEVAYQLQHLEFQHVPEKRWQRNGHVFLKREEIACSAVHLAKLNEQLESARFVFREHLLTEVSLVILNVHGALDPLAEALALENISSNVYRGLGGRIVVRGARGDAEKTTWVITRAAADIRPAPDMSTSRLPTAKAAEEAVIKKVISDPNDGLSAMHRVIAKQAFVLGFDLPDLGKKGDRVWQVHFTELDGQTAARIAWINAETDRVKFLSPEPDTSLNKRDAGDGK